MFLFQVLELRTQLQLVVPLFENQKDVNFTKISVLTHGHAYCLRSKGCESHHYVCFHRRSTKKHLTAATRSQIVRAVL